MNSYRTQGDVLKCLGQNQITLMTLSLRKHISHKCEARLSLLMTKRIIYFWPETAFVICSVERGGQGDDIAKILLQAGVEPAYMELLSSCLWISSLHFVDLINR